MAVTQPIKLDASTDLYRGQLFVFCDDLPIAFASTAQMEVSTETIDASSKMTGAWGVSIPGKKSFTLSSEALYTKKEGAMSYDTLLAAQCADKLLDFKFGEATVTEQDAWGGKFEAPEDGTCFSGKVMITALSLQSENGQLAKVSVSLTGVGALVMPTAATEPPSGGGGTGGDGEL